MISRLLLILTACLCIFCNETYAEISPYDSTASSFGNVDALPGVQYNEFTGRLFTDRSIGVNGLSFPLAYSTTKGDSFGWGFGYGMLSIVRPSTVSFPCSTSIPEVPCSGSDSLARLVEVGGVTSEFSRDYLYQQLDKTGRNITNDKHFIDAGQNRLTIDYGSKKSPLSFGEGDVYLLKTDGSQTRYQSLYTLSPEGGVGIFLPVEIQQNNGHKILLEYDANFGQPTPSHINRPYRLLAENRLVRVKESINGFVERVLFIEYRSYFSTHPEVKLPVEVCLLSGSHIDDQSCDEGQLLKTVSWNTGLNNGNPFFEVSSISTPMGYTTRFGYEGLIFGSMKLNEINLPTGGDLELKWGVYTKYECDGPNDMNTVGDWLSESKPVITEIKKFGKDSNGNRKLEQALSYDYKHITDDTINNNNFHNVRITMSNSDESYQRIRMYYGVPQVTVVTQPTKCMNYRTAPGIKVRPPGRLKFSHTTYIPPEPEHGWTDGEPESFNRYITEKWKYKTIRLFNNSPDIANQEQVDVTAGFTIDKPVVTRYSSTASGKWETTEFEYPDANTNPNQNLPNPIKITRAPGDHFLQGIPSDADRVEQYFSYQHWGNSIHSPTDDIHSNNPAPYVVGLTTQASAYLKEPSGQNQLLSKSGSYYDPTVPFPFPAETYQYSSEVDRITTHSEYYTDRSNNNKNYGYLKKTYIGTEGYATHFGQYRYGVAEKVTLPSSEEDDGGQFYNTFLARPDGLISTQIENGIKQQFIYDQDMRFKEIRWPDPDDSSRDLRASKKTSYSAPDVYPNVVRNWEIDKSRIYSEQIMDAWGRVIEERQSIDTGVISSTTTEYNSLGQIFKTVNPRGAVTIIEGFDVLARPLKTTTWADDPVNNSDAALLSYQYERFMLDDSVSGGEKHFSITGIPCSEDYAYIASECGLVRTEEYFDMLDRTHLVGTFCHSLPNGQACPPINTPGSNQIDNKHYTQIDYLSISGGFGYSKTITVSDETGINQQSRTTQYDVLDRVISESHPEIEQEIMYSYDDRGLLEQTTIGGKTEKYKYDIRDRLIATQVQLGQAYPIETIENKYHPVYGNVTETINKLSGSSIQNHYDKLGRVMSTKSVVASPRVGPTELSPNGSWTSLPTIKFEWDSTLINSFWLDLKMESLPSLKFYSATGGSAYHLDRAAMLDAIQRLDAINTEAATAYKQMVDEQSEPLFLDDSRAYQWRVRSLSDQHEPTLWSDWATLSDFQCAVDFLVHDGQEGEPPLVRWNIYSCPEQSENWSAQVFVSTVDGTVSNECKLTDQIFHATQFLGYQSLGQWRAYFMRTGYGLNGEGEPVPFGDGVINCPASDVMDFTLKVVDNTSGNELYSETSRGQVHHTAGCYIKDFTAISIGHNLPPIIKWQYSSNCTSEDNITLSMSTVTGDLSVAEDCRLYELPIYNSDLSLGDESDQWIALEMTQGYTSQSQVPTNCPGLEQALFSLEAEDTSTGTIDEWNNILVSFEESPGVNGCRLKYLSSGDSPGFAPQLHWTTTPECAAQGWQGQVVRNSVGQTQPGCLLRNSEWPRGNRLQGPATATFMVHGESINGVSCPPVDQVDFGYRMTSPEGKVYTNLHFGHPPVRLRTVPIKAPVGENCQVLHFEPMNGYHGSSPYVNWATYGCENHTVEVSISTPEHINTVLNNELPEVCRLENAVLSNRADGPAELNFMLNGYWENHIHNNQHQQPLTGTSFCDLSEIGGLYAVEARLNITDPNGVAISTPGPILVNNDNRPGENDTVGSNDMCHIQDSLEVVHAGYNVVPMLMWMTDCHSEGRYQARVVASPLPEAGLPAQCLWDDPITFQLKGDGPKPAYFLRNGYWDYHTGTVQCQPRSAEFNLQVVDTSLPVGHEEYVVEEQANPVNATYTGEQQWDPNVPSCNPSINPEGIGTAGHVPGACANIGNGLILADQVSLDFGVIQLGDSAVSQSITVSLSASLNESYELGASVENTHFQVNQTTTAINPGPTPNVVNLNVEFDPNLIGFHSDAMTVKLTKDNIVVDEIVVGLTGTAEGVESCASTSSVNYSVHDIYATRNGQVVTEVTSGERFTWHWQVTNHGPATTGAITDGVWTKERHAHIGSNIYTRFHLPSLDGNDTAHFQQTVQLQQSNSSHPRNATLSILADADQVICETNENDNFVNAVLDVKPHPDVLNTDLAVSISQPAQVPVFPYWEVIDLTFTVTNQGSVATEQTRIDFEICKANRSGICAPDDFYDPYAVSLTKSVSALQPGQSTTVRWNDFPLPSHQFIDINGPNMMVRAYVNQHHNPSEGTYANNWANYLFNVVDQ